LNCFSLPDKQKNSGGLCLTLFIEEVSNLGHTDSDSYRWLQACGSHNAARLNSGIP